jgi:AmmeMemoRadiSam system protein B
MVFAPLRPLDAFPHEQDGKRMIALRDPLGVVDGMLVVSPEAFLVASQFDGEREADAIAEEATRQLGMLVRPEIVERVAELFSERWLLFDANFHHAWMGLREEFARKPVRAAAHAGTNYPTDAGDFRLRIGGILAEAWDQPRPRANVLGLIAPHIDLERGLATYARAYGVLRDLPKIERILILGTSHGPTTQLLAPTRKDYETPLGPARTDRAAVDRLVSVLGDDAFDDEFCHKNEHSIEFQTIFLRLVQPNVEIVPVLCGSLRSTVDDANDPAGHPEVERAVEGLRAAITDTKKTLVIAAADLAHVGPRFGGPRLTHELLSETETADRRALDFAAARDAAGWFRAVTEGGDPRNTCGLAPIYWLLRLLDEGRGHLIAYRRCEAPDQCVTIGAMPFLDGEFIPQDSHDTDD